MLRITVVDCSNFAVRLRVEGRLTGPSVEELRQACDLHALCDGMRLIIDLADVSFADAHGIEILRKFERQSVTLLNPIPFLALQLRDP